MTVAVRRAPPMRIAAFLEWAATTPDEECWELLDGEPVCMAPPSERHRVIAFNLTRALAHLAEPRGCRALQGLVLLDDFVDDDAPIPDVVVRRGPLLSDGCARDPLLVAEVLSSSTMASERGRKAASYKTLQTLRQFLIVYQDETRIEVWRRDGQNWSDRALGAGDSIDLPEFGGAFAVDAVYAGIPFAAS